MRTLAIINLAALVMLGPVEGAPRRIQLAYGLEKATARGSTRGPVAAAFNSIRRGLLDSGRLYSVRGAQVFAFRVGPDAREVSLAFGFSEARSLTLVEENTLLPAGELVQPLVALAALNGGRTLADPVRPLLESYGPPAVDPELQLGHLLAMTSGAEPAATGYAAPNGAAPTLDEYLTENFRIQGAPGTRYRHSFANYALVQRILAGRDPAVLEARLRHGAFLPLGLDATVLIPGGGRRFAHGMVRSGRYYFPLSDDTAVPAANRLFVSARSYGGFLRAVLSAQQRARSEESLKLVLQPMFAFDDRLGGSAVGFSYLRSMAGPVWYRVESVVPGSAAVAVLVPGVGGVVVLATPSEPAFVRDMLSLIQEALFADVFRKVEIPKRKQMPTFPPISHVVPVDVKPLLQQFQELEGQYRPRGALSSDQQFLSFLNDTRLAISSKHGLELSGVFREDAAVELIPLGPDLFLARGNARMHGWRVRVLRQDGRVSGLLTDGMRFERVPLLFSFWGVVFLLASAFVLPTVGTLAYLVLRRRGPRPTSAGTDR